MWKKTTPKCEMKQEKEQTQYTFHDIHGYLLKKYLSFMTKRDFTGRFSELFIIEVCVAKYFERNGKLDIKKLELFK